MKYYWMALEINRQIGNHIGEGINLGNIGDLLNRAYRTGEAVKHLAETIELCGAVFPLGAGAFGGRWL